MAGDAFLWLSEALDCRLSLRNSRLSLRESVLTNHTFAELKATMDHPNRPVM